MPDNPSKLSLFWQELKRRKVVRVITVYAAAAFVILELVDIITEPLKLPEWFLPVVIVLLCIGFIIAIILSWIYDIHPEGGIVKTKPAHKVTKGDKTVTSNSWKIASYISFVVIVGLIVLNIIPRSNRSEETVILEKSIAILPFINDSPDDENEYFINGIMEEILINLQIIKDFRVPGRTSVEQYRNPTKSIPEIARELGVNYIVEGSGQRYGNKIRLRVQLVDGTNDKHLWADSYDEQINEPEDIFRIQSQIAESIAAELKAIITPEEKQLIEKMPTANLTAYDFFRKGREEQEKYWYDSNNREALERAEDLFHKALEYDSTYAQAYSGLGWVYSAKHYWEEFLEEDFLDSVLILADIALSFDDQLAEAYVLRGNYYRAHNKNEEAINEYEKALQFNPNEWLAYYNIGTLYLQYDHVNSIGNFHTAASLHRGDYLPRIYQRLGGAYAMIGFMEKYRYYIEEALKLDDDSATYYVALAVLEDVSSNFEKAIELGKKSYAMDSTNLLIISTLGFDHMYLGQFEESLKYFKKYVRRTKTLDRPLSLNIFRIGYAYWVNGFKEEAEYYFNTGLELHNEVLELGRYYYRIDFHTFYGLAAIYAFQGDKEKAFENLRLFNRSQWLPLYMIKDIKNDPLFDNIRDEPEFQQIVKDIEAKYQAEHERVRKWLEEQGML